MNFFPHPCIAPPSSSKLRAKQVHATSAKPDRFSAFSFLKFRIPSVSASRNRGAHSAFPNKIPPFRLYPDSVGASRPLRPLRAKARPRNAGRESSAPRSPITNLPSRPLRPWREQSAFTLIELMAATTVLSVILLMMVGMQDQMSKAWSNSNRRTDATREARAACRLMAEDLSCLVFRPLAFDNSDSYARGLENQGIPFLYSSNGSGPITISSSQPGAAYFFGISARKPAVTGPGDLAIVGYYIATKFTTNVSGFTNTTYNLYRHYVPASNAVSSLNAWFAAPTNNRPANLLFTPDPTKDDILARNTCNLRITVYNRREGNTKGLGNKVTNGLNYQCVSGASVGYNSGSKIQAEISVYPEDLAQKITYTNWGSSTNIQKYARSYEFRVDVPRN